MYSPLFSPGMPSGLTCSLLCTQPGNPHHPSSFIVPNTLRVVVQEALLVELWRRDARCVFATIPWNDGPRFFLMAIVFFALFPRMNRLFISSNSLRVSMSLSLILTEEGPYAGVGDGSVSRYWLQVYQRDGFSGSLGLVRQLPNADVRVYFLELWPLKNKNTFVIVINTSNNLDIYLIFLKGSHLTDDFSL